MKQRNLSIEILRFLLMFFICFYHFYLHGKGYKESNYQKIDQSWLYPLEMGFISICNIGVTGFIFISGYFGINFTYKKFISILTEIFFYSVLLCILVPAFYSGGEPFSLSYLRSSLWPARWWWFMESYIILMFVSPFINIGVRHLSQPDYLKYLIGIFFVAYVLKLLSGNIGTEFFLFLFIYLLGQYIRIYSPPIKKYATKFFIISISIIFLLPVILAYYLDGKWIPYLIGNYNPLTLIAGCSVFFVFDKWNIINKKLSWLGTFLSGILAIYLITDFPLVRIMYTSTIPTEFHNPFYVIIIILGIMVLCLLLDTIRRFILTPIDNLLIMGGVQIWSFIKIKLLAANKIL